MLIWSKSVQETFNVTCLENTLAWQKKQPYCNPEEQAGKFSFPETVESVLFPFLYEIFIPNSQKKKKKIHIEQSKTLLHFHRQSCNISKIPKLPLIISGYKYEEFIDVLFSLIGHVMQCFWSFKNKKLFYSHEHYPNCRKTL